MEILIYLLKHKKTTYKQLAQHVEVSVKTIERDINRLSAMGIPVSCTQGVGGGVRLEESYKFGTSFFTAADLRQMIFALKIMDSLSQAPGENTIIDKLCLIAPELSAMFANDAEQYLSVDLLSEKVGTENEVCEKIDFCFDHEVLALIDGTRRVAPIGYVLKTDGLYLFCFSEDYQLLPCREMTSVEPTEISFERSFLTYEAYRARRSEPPRPPQSPGQDDPA